VLNAFITDWGGVLTEPIRDIIRAWIEAEKIDRDVYTTVMRPWLSGAYQDDGEAGVNPVHRLERGECTATEFEDILAARLVRTDGAAVVPDGLLNRMLSASEIKVPAMYDLIRSLRAKGLRTGLLSNSWGTDGYPRDDFAALFDAVVISAEVGMRKPEPRIFRHVAELLGLVPAECVFIDDAAANVDAAIACGMTGIWHTHPADTAARLTQLFADR
jgi:putative hydrolase of the HAD superfamily